MNVGIIGTGSVGGAAAYALILSGAASGLVLVDPDEGLAQAQAEDLEDATPFAHPARLLAGGYELLAGVDVAVLCCGARQQPGETRLQLLGRNAALFRKVAARVKAAAPDALQVVVSNPVDVLTAVVARETGLPPGRVFGTGTLLDSARFRARLGAMLGIAPRSVHGYVLGEHGDSEVLLWSTAAVGGMPLAAFAEQIGRPLTEAARSAVDAGVRHAAARIIQGKGATWFGIGGAVAQVVRAVREDRRALMTLTGPAPGWPGCPCFSLPRIVGAGGVQATFLPTLDAREREGLDRCAGILREAAAGL